MSRELTVDFASIDRLARELSLVNRNIEAILNTLDAQAAALRNEWTGEAWEAFDLAHKNWTAELAAMNAAVERISAAVARAGTRHEQRETRNVSVWT
jgi:WXG100 family type VII secretion target